MEIDFMYKIHCELNEDKINSEAIYSLSEMTQTLDKMAHACELKKDYDGWYIGEGENSNAFIMALLNTKWFLDNAKEWKLWNLKRNTMEDALDTYNRKKDAYE